MISLNKFLCFCLILIHFQFCNGLSSNTLEKEKRSFLNYPARCGVSKVSYRKTTVMYKWEVQGLIKFLDYVKEFDETFVHETDLVKFTSPDDINGVWKFKVQSSKTSGQTIPYTFISGKYTYEETSKNQRLNIGLKIKIIYGPLYSPSTNEFKLTKPTEKYTQRVKTMITNLVTTPRSSPVSQADFPPTPASPRRVLPAWFSTSATSSEEEDDDEENKRKTSKGTKPPPKLEKFVEVNRVTVTFETVNIQPLLEELKKQTEGSNDESSAVDFTFVINYYLPNEAIVTEEMKCYIGNFTHQHNAFGIQVQESVAEVDKTVKTNGNNVQNPPEVEQQSKTEEVIKKEQIERDYLSSPPFIGHLDDIFNIGEYSDMTLIVQGMKFPVHRVIVSNSSPYLAQMIRTSNNLAEFKPFDETTVGQNATKEILRYMYTGQVQNLELLADKIILGAHQVGLPKLEKMCISLLLRDINIHNAIQIYSLAKDVESEALTKAAVAVIRENKQAVVSQSKEFQKLAAKYPAIIFDLFLS